jgi:hypothetical protein
MNHSQIVGTRFQRHFCFFKRVRTLMCDLQPGLYNSLCHRRTPCYFTSVVHGKNPTLDLLRFVPAERSQDFWSKDLMIESLTFVKIRCQQGFACVPFQGVTKITNYSPQSTASHQVLHRLGQQSTVIVGGWMGTTRVRFLQFENR